MCTGMLRVKLLCSFTSYREDEKKELSPASSNSPCPPHPQSEKMETVEGDREEKEGGTYVIQAHPMSSKYIKQARNQSTAGTNKPIVLNRVPQLSSQDRAGVKKELSSAAVFPAPPVKADKSKSESDNRSQEIEAEVCSFLKMAETKKLTVAENRHHSTFSDFRNGNILDFQRRSEKVDLDGMDGSGFRTAVADPEEMDWTPSDSKYLKSKRSIVSLAGGVGGSSVGCEPMESARPSHEDAQTRLGVVGGSGVGVTEGGEDRPTAANNTYVMNITANSLHNQAAGHAKSKDSVEKKKVGSSLTPVLLSSSFSHVPCIGYVFGQKSSL